MRKGFWTTQHLITLYVHVIGIMLIGIVLTEKFPVICTTKNQSLLFVRIHIVIKQKSFYIQRIAFINRIVQTDCSVQISGVAP